LKTVIVVPSKWRCVSIDFKNVTAGLDELTRPADFILLSSINLSLWPREIGVLCPEVPIQWRFPLWGDAPRWRSYYWVGGDPPKFLPENGTDFGTLEAGYVYITPLQLELTGYESLESLSQWDGKT